MTYDNARLCEALIRAGQALGDHALAARRPARCSTSTPASWSKTACSSDRQRRLVSARRARKARYGQQPIEAAGLSMPPLPPTRQPATRLPESRHAVDRARLVLRRNTPVAAWCPTAAAATGSTRKASSSQHGRRVHLGLSPQCDGAGPALGGSAADRPLNSSVLTPGIARRIFSRSFKDRLGRAQVGPFAQWPATL